MSYLVAVFLRVNDFDGKVGAIKAADECAGRVQVELLDNVCSAFDLQPRGSSGEHSAAVGAKFDVSNKRRLGFSEVQLVQMMIDGVTKVVEFEKLLASGVSPNEIRKKLVV